MMPGERPKRKRRLDGLDLIMCVGLGFMIEPTVAVAARGDVLGPLYFVAYAVCVYRRIAPKLPIDP